MSQQTRDDDPATTKSPVSVDAPRIMRPMRCWLRLGIVVTLVLSIPSTDVPASLIDQQDGAVLDLPPELLRSPNADRLGRSTGIRRSPSAGVRATSCYRAAEPAPQLRQSAGRATDTSAQVRPLSRDAPLHAAFGPQAP